MCSSDLALLRRRDDGPEVYGRLVEELAGHEVSGETRRTVAGILAISLEPAQALRRWLEARRALEDVGLADEIDLVVAGGIRNGADVAVRINRPMRLAMADLEAAIRPGLSAVFVTKTEGVQHLRLLDEVVSELERERGMAPGKIGRAHV